METAVELVILMLLMLANGVFAAAEIAVVSARKARLEALADDGDRSALAVLELKAAPDRFLSTVQVGITLIGVIAGAFGGAALSEEFAAVIAGVPALAPYAASIAIVVVVALITYLSVVIGELVPKQIALVHAEGFAKALAGPMRTLSTASAPLIWLLTGSSNVILRALRVKTGGEPVVTEEEIKVILEQGAQAGVLGRGEHTLVERVMEFVDRRVESMMTPRTQLVWVDANAPIGENMRAMSEAEHSYFPVCDGDVDKVIGVVSVKDLWRRVTRDKQVPDLREAAMTVPYVPESMPALKLLETLKQSGRHIALVLDEYGGVSGIVTLHDIMEAVVGDLPEPAGTGDEWAVRRGDGSWLLDGMFPVADLEDRLELDELPEDAADLNTVAGLVLARLGHIPRVGESVEWAGFRFEVVDMDGFRIDRVLATRIAQNP
ncbi:MAG: hypothetical protein AMXMBFR47_45880 [Planctomycetota bacterium]